MERNYPIMRDRMKGYSYGLWARSNNATFDTNTIPYNVGSLACSMTIYFPPDTTANGHAITSRNLEWYLVPMDVYLNKAEKETGNRVLFLGTS